MTCVIQQEHSAMVPTETASDQARYLVQQLFEVKGRSDGAGHLSGCLQLRGATLVLAIAFREFSRSLAQFIRTCFKLSDQVLELSRHPLKGNGQLSNVIVPLLEPKGSVVSIGHSPGCLNKMLNRRSNLPGQMCGNNGHDQNDNRENHEQLAEICSEGRLPESM